MLNLILVDDDKNQLFLNQILFAEEGIFKDILTFQNPISALEHIKSKSDLSNDLIVVDINMPEMTAWDLLNSINVDCNIQKKENLNLFIASYSVNPKDIETATQHNLVTKFINKDNLISEMTEYAKSFGA